MKHPVIVTLLIFVGVLHMSCHKTDSDKSTADLPVLPDTPVLGNWSFRDERNTYSGNITKADFRDSLGRGLLSLSGHMHTGNPDSTFELSIYFPRQSIDTGGYLTSDIDYGNYFLFRTFPAGKEIYYAGVVASPPSISIQISA